MFSGIVHLPWWGYVIVTLALTHVTVASVTIYLHRHQAHRALDLHPLPAHFFRFWLWLTTGMVTREWAAVHRKHHARCETVDDPHSPRVLGLGRVLWGGVFLYVKATRDRQAVARYGHGTPDDWIERRVYTPLHPLGIFLMLAIDVVLFGVWPGGLVWGVQMLWIPFWGAGVINGIGHCWGYRNFAVRDASTNIVPWGFLIGGEELHNNHHAYAASARLSNKWFEFDIGWLYIRLMALLRLAQVKKVAPRLRLLGRARAAVDAETLRAVIACRYELLSKYLKSLRQIAREELARLGEDGRSRRLVRRSIGADADALPVPERASLASLLERSERLRLLVAMRAELEGLWQRSTATQEQLLRQLQDWVRRAEESGIRQLEEFSLRLRRYALCA